MNGKPRDMDYKFAIKVLQSAKVDTPSMHGNPKRYGYQNQTFYDIARNMAVQALKEKHENANNKGELYKEILAKVGEIITEIYNKHIFGSNDLTDEEADAVINFSDDVTYALDKALKELVGDGSGKM